MIKGIKKVIVSSILVMILVVGFSTNILAATQMSYSAKLSGNTVTATLTNKSDGARYYTNTIYGTSVNGATTGGTCVEYSSGSVEKGVGITITGNVKKYSHAYAKGCIYRGNVYYSGMDGCVARILK